MTAGLAYREIIGNRYDLVIVLGPSYFVRIDGAAIILHGAFTTPFGMVEIDSEAVRKIYSNSPSLFTVSSLPFLREHSVEVQLPFLQMALDDFTFVPIEVNMLEEDFLSKIADAIYSAVTGKNVLVVACTDLSHFKTRDEIVALDRVFRERMRALDYHALTRDLRIGKCEACGGAAFILALMVWEKMGAATVAISGYSDSGVVTGDENSVVGYLSALALKKENGTF